VVFSHDGIATDVHKEVNHDTLRETQEHPGYEWLTYRVCGIEFERGKGAEVRYSRVFDTCGDINCGKVAA